MSESCSFSVPSAKTAALPLRWDDCGSLTERGKPAVSAETAEVELTAPRVTTLISRLPAKKYPG